MHTNPFTMWLVFIGILLMPPRSLAVEKEAVEAAAIGALLQILDSQIAEHPG